MVFATTALSPDSNNNCMDQLSFTLYNFSDYAFTTMDLPIQKIAWLKISTSSENWFDDFNGDYTIEMCTIDCPRLY